MADSDPDTSPQYDADAALAAALRAHISDAVKGQWQLLQVATALAGAALSVAPALLLGRPLLLALASILFLGFAFAILRQDQEISVIALHLVDEDALGPHAVAQLRYEQRKVAEMRRKGPVRWIATTVQASAVYAVPMLAATVTYVAAVQAVTRSRSTDVSAMLALAVAALLLVALVIGILDVIARYAELGRTHPMGSAEP